MNGTTKRIVLPAALFLAATPAFAQSARIVSQGAAYAYAEERAAIERTVERALGAPARGGAQVVFFRPAGEAGDMIVTEGGRTVARLSREGHAAIPAAPGMHAFTVGGKPLRLQLRAGERRYVRVAERPDGPRLLPSQGPRFLRTSLAGR